MARIADTRMLLPEDLAVTQHNGDRLISPGIGQARRGWDYRDANAMRKHYLLVSDFDQTLSFNDSGIVLSELLGIPDFADKVAGGDT